MMNSYHINLSKFSKKEYTKEEIKKMSEIEIIGLLFKTRSRDQMEIICERNEKIVGIKKIYEELSNKQEFIEEYTKEELEKFAYGEETYDKGISEGSYAKEIEIAKKMFNDNVDLSIILKYTGLSEEELKSLK